MEKQNTHARRRQADRIDTIALIVGVALTIGLASWRVSQMAETHAKPTPVVTVAVAEQGRGR